MSQMRQRGLVRFQIQSCGAELTYGYNEEKDFEILLVNGEQYAKVFKG